MAVNWAPIYDNARGSMFFVMLTPSERDVHVKELNDIADLARTMNKGKKGKDRLRETRVSTGFAVGMVVGDVGILTTAHAIEHLFRATRPITRGQINRLFTVRVLCGHYENAYREAATGDERDYTIGRVVGIDCANDLMLIAASAAELRRFGGGICQEPHPAMPTCGGLDLVDPPTHECLVVSWPSYKPDLMSIGRIGAVRTVNQISQPNRCEYAMNLLEVQVVTGQGSSGAPLLNSKGEVIGVLHGAHLQEWGDGGHSHSYFIRLDHVMESGRKIMGKKMLS